MIPLPRERLQALSASPGAIQWGAAPLQSGLGRCPWRVAIASMLCSRTRRTAAEPVLRELLTRWPTAAALARADWLELEQLLQPLGLHRARSRRLTRFSSMYCGEGWHDLRDLAGVGKYVADAVGLCCFGCTELESTDGAMQTYAQELEANSCAGCGLPAVSEYEGDPSCGRASCELRMQRAIDYNAEAGDR